jgi:hypothetical protein
MRRGWVPSEHTVADGPVDNAPTLVERWIEEQQQWQRTLLGYLDSMAKNEEFLVHLGNAMRGSLLGGKPYPMAPMAAPSAASPAAAVEPGNTTSVDDRLDTVLFAVHQMQGQLNDLAMTLEELRAGLATPPPRTPRAANTGRRRTTAAPPRRKPGKS